jgi:hypothetical protein
MLISKDTEYCSDGCNGTPASNPRLAGISRFPYRFTVIVTGGRGAGTPIFEGMNGVAIKAW